MIRHLILYIRLGVHQLSVILLPNTQIFQIVSVLVTSFSQEQQALLNYQALIFLCFVKKIFHLLLGS